MTTKEATLDGARSEFAQITATALSNWGMLPDPEHLAGGGYHCGCQDIKNIGAYPDGDYSTRQQRDRVGGNVSMAIDGPPAWGNGGDAAWIRHNNLLQQQMAAGDPALGALRAINYTPDGKVKRRYDTNCRACGIIVSKDTVLWHTHYEFWRDTAGTALLRRTVARMAQIMRAAIANTPLPPEPQEGEMSFNADVPLEGGTRAIVVSNGINCRWITAGEAAESLARWGKSTPASVNAVGVLVGPVPKGWLGLKAPTAADLAKELAPLLDVAIGDDTVVEALESERGQAALTKAANAAEDS